MSCMMSLGTYLLIIEMCFHCSHVLEHLSVDDLRVAPRKTHGYLKVGGVFRLVVPDLEQQITAYVASSEVTAASDFMNYTRLGRRTRPRGIVALVREHFGNSHHLWTWDCKGMTAELRAAGFRDIRRCRLGDSANPAYSAVEDPGRFESALAKECTK